MVDHMILEMWQKTPINVRGGRGKRDGGGSKRRRSMMYLPCGLCHEGNFPPCSDNLRRKVVLYLDSDSGHRSVETGLVSGWYMILEAGGVISVLGWERVRQRNEGRGH